MKRRDLLKSFLVAPFVGLFKKAKPDVIIFPTEEKAREYSQKRIESKFSCSTCMSGHPSAENSAEPEDDSSCADKNFIYKSRYFRVRPFYSEHRLITLLKGKWSFSYIVANEDFAIGYLRNLYCDQMIERLTKMEYELS